jgi:hypothetical protein
MLVVLCVAETVLHVMRNCLKVMQVWLNLVHTRCRNQFFAEDYKFWISFNINNGAGWNLETDWIVCGLLHVILYGNGETKKCTQRNI